MKNNLFKEKPLNNINKYLEFLELKKELSYKEKKLSKPLVLDFIPLYKQNVENIVLDTAIISSIGNYFRIFGSENFSTNAISTSIILFASAMVKYLISRKERKEDKQFILDTNKKIKYYDNIISRFSNAKINTFIPDRTQNTIASLDYIIDNSLIHLNVNELNNRLVSIYREEYESISS